MNYFTITYETTTGYTTRTNMYNLSTEQPFFNRDKVCKFLKQYHKMHLNEDVNPIIFFFYKFESKEEYDCFIGKTDDDDRSS